MGKYSERLTVIRKAKKMSVYRLSQLSEVSENHIRSIEKDKSQPSIFLLERLLEALGMSLAEFFNNNECVLYPTEAERELIAKVRELDSEQAKAVLNLVKHMNRKKQ